MRRFIALIALMFLVAGCGDIGYQQNQIANPAAIPGVSATAVQVPLALESQGVTDRNTIKIPFAAVLGTFPPITSNPALKNIKLWFGDTWDDETTYGYALVTIPPNHELGDPSGQRIDVLDNNRIDAQVLNRSTSGYLRLNTVEKTTQADFSKVVIDNKPGDIVLMIHGYNTRPEDAIYRAAQFKADTKYERPIIAFMWPSGFKGGAIGYVAGKNGVMSAQSHLVEVLKTLAADDQIKRIHILAHSMGALMIVQALSEYSREKPSSEKLKIGAIVLAAPALPISIYSDRLKTIRAMISGKITVYASTNDRPLWFGSKSAVYDREQLLGYIPPDKKVPAIVPDDVAQYIDASNGTTQSGLMSWFLRHSIFLEDDGLRNDVVTVLNDAGIGRYRNPEERNRELMRPVVEDGRIYWRYNGPYNREETVSLHEKVVRYRLLTTDDPVLLPPE
jgi:esterase/lipase superfamily enzyme